MVQIRKTAHLSALKARATWFWQARAPREQQGLAAAAAVVIAALVYAFVYEPAAQGIAKLTQSLPTTQMQASQAEQLQAQIATASPQGLAASGKADFSTKLGIDAGLQAAGIAATAAQTSLTAPFGVTINSASGDALWAWLRTAPLSAGTFKRSPNGTWAGTATLTP
jgi:general secretion pathway protein M